MAVERSLRLVASITRHGDRAPVLLASEGAAHHSHVEEAQFWTSAIAQRPKHHPVDNPNNPHGTFDKSVFPLGNLTQLGAQQCVLRGRKLARRYAHHRPSATVQASNYERTQLSARHLLSGLLGEDAPPVRIRVDSSVTCGIGTFEGGGGLMPAAKALFLSDDFQSRERALKHVSAALSAAIPFFRGAPSAPSTPSPAPVSTSVIHKVSMGDDGTPGSRWMWIRAADVFSTYRAHGLPLDVFSHPAVGEEGVSAWEDLTHEHLLWRFRTLYTTAHILPLAIGTLLQQLQGVLHAAWAKEAAGRVGAGGTGEGDGTGGTSAPASGSTLTGSDGPPLPFHLYSGHDVTLLPLLFALVLHGGHHQAPPAGVARGASSLPPPSSFWDVHARLGKGVDVKHDSGKWSRLRTPAALVHAVGWPKYASCVSLELHVPPSRSEGAPLVRWVWDNEALAPVKEQAEGQAEEVGGELGAGGGAEGGARAGAVSAGGAEEAVGGDGYVRWAEGRKDGGDGTGVRSKLERPDRAAYMEGVMTLQAFDSVVAAVMQ